MLINRSSSLFFFSNVFESNMFYLQTDISAFRTLRPDSMMITTARLRADGAASKKHFQSFHFLQCVLLAVSGAGGTILKSSTFLHERVRRANADMSKIYLQKATNMQVHSG